MTDLNKLGGWAIQESCYNFIKTILPEGSTILEFGSGVGTGYLSQHYKMISIENYPEWIGKYNSKYIHAPIVNYNETYTAPNIPGAYNSKQVGWYDVEIIKQHMPLTYDLILVDGPNGAFGRGGFLKHLDMFNTNVPIIFDDINREEWHLMVEVSNILNRPYKELDKYTGYIL
jgi:hypothetical protein